MPGLLGLGLDSLTIGVLSSVYGMDTFLCLLRLVRAVCILSTQYVVRLLIEYAYYAYCALFTQRALVLRIAIMYSLYSRLARVQARKP